MFSYVELVRDLSQNSIFASKTSVFSLCSVKHRYRHRFARLISYDFISKPQSKYLIYPMLNTICVWSFAPFISFKFILYVLIILYTVLHTVFSIYTVTFFEQG